MEIAVEYRIAPLRFVTFTTKHMLEAEKMVGNYTTKSQQPLKLQHSLENLYPIGLKFYLFIATFENPSF